VRAYIGLGSNLDEPRAHIERAFEDLARLPSARLVAVSPLYRSRPIGPQPQPDYINAVAELDTMNDPMRLLAQLQRIETRHGRIRPAPQHWGPRPLDLDLLIYGRARIQTARLVVPHPRLAERGFVLYPLADVAPELCIPGFGRLPALLARVSMDGLQRLN
jgi:2-amino-4-hydroxy-6-hydroxymethyldihydropteridine diphosphokinase